MIRNDQRLPFQRSASSWLALSARFQTVPTATHARLDVHDTPPKEGSIVPGGAGVLSLIHRKPFHRNTDESPATIHAVPDPHETLLRTAPDFGGGRWTDQPDAKGDPVLTATIANDRQATTAKAVPRKRSQLTRTCSRSRIQPTG